MQMSACLYPAFGSPNAAGTAEEHPGRQMVVTSNCFRSGCSQENCPGHGGQRFGSAVAGSQMPADPGGRYGHIIRGQIAPLAARSGS
jgi:hypothetical protein